MLVLPICLIINVTNFKVQILLNNEHQYSIQIPEADRQTF